MHISLSAFAPENLVSGDGFGSPAPHQPAYLHTQDKAGSYLLGFLPISAAASMYLFIPPYCSPSGLSRVTHLRTDGVHFRKSAGTGPVVSNECCLGRSPWIN